MRPLPLVKLLSFCKEKLVMDVVQVLFLFYFSMFLLCANLDIKSMLFTCNLDSIFYFYSYFEELSALLGTRLR